MTRSASTAVALALSLVALLLAGCSKSKSDDPADPNPPLPTTTVGGTVTGLDGTLELQLTTDPPVVGGLQSVTVTTDGPFTFPIELPQGAVYTVTVVSAPSSQLCTLSNATGTVGTTPITNVGALCENTYFVSVTVAGLGGPGLGLVLDLNGAQQLTVQTNGTVTFPTPLTDGSAYDVTVETQPMGQLCVITNGSGVISGADVVNVMGTCNAAFTVGGTINGQTGAGLELTLTPTLGAVQTITIDSVAPVQFFEFPTPVLDGESYIVSITQEPDGQTCTIMNAGGVISGAPVTDVQIDCTDVFTVGGTVTGLTGTGLVLNLNGTEDLPIAADGAFEFTSELLDGAMYTVTVTSDPTGQVCNLTMASGTIASADVTDVTATCVNTFTVGGTLSGLAGGRSVTLQLNGGDDLTLNADGAFEFSTPLTDGSMYAVTVLTPPTGQQVTLSNDTGTLAGADVTNVGVDCVNLYTVGGTVSGLTGAGLVLQINGGDDLAISANGPYEFATPLTDGTMYTVTVQSHPAGQLCTLSNASGTLAGADVTNVDGACTTAFPVSGTVTGLTGAGLVLQLNGGDDLAILADGPFQFATPVEDGMPYAVTVLTPPSAQEASVVNGSGTISTPGASDVEVYCGATLFDVGGDVSGLGGGDDLELSLNGGDQTLMVTVNGSFTFPTQLVEGTPYEITVSSQPATGFAVVEAGSGPVDDVDTADNTNALVYVIDVPFDPTANEIVGLDDSQPSIPHSLTTTGAAATALLSDDFLGLTDVRALTYDESDDVYYAANATTQRLLIGGGGGSPFSDLGAVGHTLEGLAWDNSDTLFGVEANSGGFRIIEVNQGTGAGTPVGTALGTGDPDAATSEKQSNNLFVSTSDGPSPTFVTLYEVSLTPSPAVVNTYAMSAAEGRILGLAYDDKAKRLYATREDGSGQEIDPTNGTVVNTVAGLFDGWPSVEGLAWEDASSRFGAVHSNSVDGTALLHVSAAADDVYASQSLGRALYTAAAQDPTTGDVFLFLDTEVYLADGDTGDTRYVDALPGTLTATRAAAYDDLTAQLLVAGPTASGQGLVVLDPTNLASFSQSALSGQPGGLIRGLASRPAGAGTYLLFDSVGDDVLTSVNVGTGAVTTIGTTTGLSLGTGMVWDEAGGQLLVNKPSTTELYSVDESTGAPSLVGSSGVVFTTILLLE